MNKYNIYFDGSDRMEASGWAFVVYKNDNIVNVTFDNMVKNNGNFERMELIAILNAIDWVEKNTLSDDNITFYTDYNFIINFLNPKVKVRVRYNKDLTEKLWEKRKKVKVIKIEEKENKLARALSRNQMGKAYKMLSTEGE